MTLRSSRMVLLVRSCFSKTNLTAGENPDRHRTSLSLALLKHMPLYPCPLRSVVSSIVPPHPLLNHARTPLSHSCSILKHQSAQ